MKKLIIAIDGHSSCGKSTLAKAVANYFSYKYIDTGAMYRAVTLFALQQCFITKNKIEKNNLRFAFEKNEININFVFNSETKKSETYLNNINVEDKIRDIYVSNFVSPIAEIDFVRKNLLKLQQNMGTGGGIIMDGRDIGTAVFPNADLKIFLTADANIRANRRYKELSEKGKNISFAEIKENITKRDYIDSHRKNNPLRKADDAILIDNSFLTPEKQTNKVIELIKSIIRI